MELDGDFDDDGVYDRVILESRYDKSWLKPDESPTRFMTRLKNLRNKLKRVGYEKTDETFLYDILKKLPTSGEYENEGMEIQKALRPREVLKKKKPYISEDELNKLHPLMKIKEVKELLRMKWEWVVKKKSGPKKPKEHKEETGKKKKNERKKNSDEKKGDEKKGEGGRANTAGDKKSGCNNFGDPGHYQRDCPKPNHLSQVQKGGT